MRFGVRLGDYGHLLVSVNALKIARDKARELHPRAIRYEC